MRHLFYKNDILANMITLKIKYIYLIKIKAIEILNDCKNHINQ